MLRRRAAYSWPEAAAIRSISRCSWPSALTTRTPAIAMLATCATSASHCCAAYVAGPIFARDRRDTSHSSGTTNIVTAPSSGCSVNISTTVAAVVTATPASFGSEATARDIALMSRFSRAASCPGGSACPSGSIRCIRRCTASYTRNCASFAAFSSRYAASRCAA